ncbi:polyribonucleotide 5'-hydroxyl-kinase [Strigomonas culicis]|uniref:Polyribonucleotide 5'-hydroxyl-kinase n=1 Tax=Strigomonas culicis TaxID=28005 RepID=S9VT71_9TRYP|nr:polyribonucleotide 5'-hydroxyl-kinase [Strigomonas culicis]|eukprot:EPY30326.1 polyribonucleotide 5'-hydroxyl-kinase [Strigomonas culicis]
MQVLNRKQRVCVPKYGELRITTPREQDGTKLILYRSHNESEAWAEIGGKEVPLEQPVVLPPGRFFRVFSVTGCTITVTGAVRTLQRSFVTLTASVWMHSLLDIHAHLEHARANAKRNESMGPRILFVSDRRQCGKSHYISWLLQYAVRLGYHPLLLDGEPSHPCFGCATCLSLFCVQYPLDVEEELSFVPGLHVFTGCTRSSNAPLYVHGIRQLARVGMERVARDERCRVGGLFLDYGTVDRYEVERAEQPPKAHGDHDAPLVHPLDTLLDVISAVDIDRVFIVESAWLRMKLYQRAAERFGEVRARKIVDVPDDAPRDNDLRFGLFLVDSLRQPALFSDAEVQRRRWLRYFFGTPTSPVRPVLVTYDVASLRLATLGGREAHSMSTLMPMVEDEVEGDVTAKRKVEAATIHFVTADDVTLKRRILAVSNASEYETLPDGTSHRIPFSEFEQSIRDAVVVGFALVESVQQDKVSLLVSNRALLKRRGTCAFVTDEYLKASD